MRFSVSKKPVTTVAHDAWSWSEFLIVATGGAAMLLVVGLFDALNLLP